MPPTPGVAGGAPPSGRSRGRLADALPWALSMLLPFLVYLAPYALVLGRGVKTPGVATFTVDEPLYLAEARALAEGRPATWNPWTRSDGSAPDTYRVFAGALLPAAAWELTGLDRGLGLGVASGLAAATATLLTAAILRRVLPAGRRRWVLLLAPLAVLLPWGALGEVARLRLRLDDLGSALPMARPFTSQWGPVAVLLGLWASLEAHARGGSVRSLGLGLVLLLQAFTFPYAVPLTLGVHLAPFAAARARSTPWGRALATGLPAVAAALVGLAWASTRALPAEAEAAHAAVAAPRVGGAIVLAIALAGLAWVLRGRFRPEAASFLPTLCAMLAAGQLADAVLPARLQFAHHVAYLADAVLALATLAVVSAVTPAHRPRASASLAVAALAVAAGYAALSVGLAVAARTPALRRQAMWASALSSLPAGPGRTLLAEGESLEGPGAWAGLLSTLPCLYSVTSEFSTSPSLEDRQWRRAWYHHLRGLSSEEVRREGTGVVRRWPRVFGAHNNAPAPEVLPSLADKLRRIEEGSPEATSVLRSFGTVVCLEAADAATFREDRLRRFLEPVERLDLSGARCTVYAVRGH